ncbi:MAG: flagellar hook-basal body complex protein FliE [Thermodesulfobacteriaceae bacterium]|nr:flagellar hook-basal body complex protein FliE [Thermodesulfobacteriaceae bacterium]MCX8041693.1 flagellar hook-basal body complex protein FliE [Thermodesulfobacteriaceae bacterium]MDW8135894.1 flagellar hook-basal body complex protein FliE [Thermodesulfobacterium sp.]
MKINPYSKGLNLSLPSKTSISQNKESLSFKEFLFQKIKEVDESEKLALKAIESLAKGEDVDLSEVAMRISKADTNFKLLLRIRNKILEAYQEIMRMQI